MRNLFWRLWGGNPVRNTEAPVRKERKAKLNLLIVTNFVHVINASVSIIIYSVSACALRCVLIYLYINGIYYIRVCRTAGNKVQKTVGPDSLFLTAVFDSRKLKNRSDVNGLQDNRTFNTCWLSRFFLIYRGTVIYWPNAACKYSEIVFF